METQALKIILMILFWLWLSFAAGCASAPARLPQETAAPPEITQEQTAPEPEPYIDFFAADAEPEPKSLLPEECRGLEEHRKGACWHAYLSSGYSVPFGGRCEYSFQCNQEKSPNTCQFNVDSSNPGHSVCTLPLPEER